jgi:hypothetical protein
MRRGLAISLLLTAVPAAGASAAEAKVPAGVRLTACSLEQREATFYARMRQVDGSDRMRLRFQLLEKGGSGYRVVAAPGLDRWHSSRPDVGALRYRQTVRGLQPGAAYRTRVEFRWYDADGNRIATVRRRSPPCRQFEALPNLGVTLVAAEPGARAGVARYRLRLTNSGVAPASDVPVRLAVDRTVVNTVTVASLAPGETRLLTIHGPACESWVEAVADPDGVLVESSEADNVHRLACADLPAP